MSKLTGFLLTVVGLLAGIIIGFSFAPVKKGLNIECGNNCGNYNAQSDKNADEEKEK